MIFMRKILVLFIIFMMLVPFVCAGDTKHVGDEKVVSEKPTTEKVTDKTKEKTTEITSKDKSITGKITVTDTDISKYKVEKKSSTEISISKEEAKGEHTKAKVSISKSELQKIDIDKDGKFGLLHISDTGEVTHTTATEAELVAGKVMTFSTNIVNGYSGYKQYTFSDVESGDTLNIDDVSGNYTISAAVSGTVPTYTAITENNISTWPGTPAVLYPLNGNANDISGNNINGTATGIKWNSTYAYFDGVSGRISTFNVRNVIGNSTNHSVFFEYLNPTNDGKFIYSGTGSPRFYLIAEVTNKYRWGYGSANPEVNVAPITNTRQCVVVTVDTQSNTMKIYQNGELKISYPYTSTEAVLSELIQLGGYGPYKKMSMWNFGVYTSVIPQTTVRMIYAGGSGISFQPEPSYNFTGYNVASGVEKVLNTDSTCTGIEYVDTTGGTHDVTVTVYFTEDITVISDSHTATMQTVNISHTSSNTAQDGKLIPYDILDEYFGTIDFDTTNPNATITRNATHFMVDTGYITANTTYYYNVSIPNYVEEMVWSDWDPTNETCNAKVQIGNSTPYTTWVFNLTNVTNSNAYNLRYTNSTLIASATAVNNTAIITATGLLDGTYWITETGGFSNIHFVVGIAFVGGIFVLAAGAFSNQRRKRNQ